MIFSPHYCTKEKERLQQHEHNHNVIESILRPHQRSTISGKDITPWRKVGNTVQYKPCKHHSHAVSE